VDEAGCYKGLSKPSEIPQPTGCRPAHRAVSNIVPMKSSWSQPYPAIQPHLQSLCCPGSSWAVVGHLEANRLRHGTQVHRQVGRIGHQRTCRNAYASCACDMPTGQTGCVSASKAMACRCQPSCCCALRPQPKDRGDCARFCVRGWPVTADCDTMLDVRQARGVCGAAGCGV
jgi:hypothetical protein